MIGQTISSQSRATPAVVVLFVLGALFVVWAVLASNVELAIASTLPFAIALTLQVSRSRSVTFDVGDSGLDFGSGEKIPYDSMEGLWIAGGAPERNEVKLKRGPITLMHENGVLRIPDRLNVRSDDLYRFLLDRITPSGSRDVNEFLAGHLRREVGTFGEDRVFSYRGRHHLGESGGPGGGFAATMLATFVTGLLWIAIGELSPDRSGWSVAGCFSCAFSVVALIVERLCRSAFHLNRIRRQATLVISPGGIAMVQDRIKGTMSWDELVDVRLVGQKRFLDATNPRGILLSVEASKFFILDVYERPLPVIYRRIMAYWKRPVLA